MHLSQIKDLRSVDHSLTQHNQQGMGRVQACTLPAKDINKQERLICNKERGLSGRHAPGHMRQRTYYICRSTCEAALAESDLQDASDSTHGSMWVAVFHFLGP